MQCVPFGCAEPSWAPPQARSTIANPVPAPHPIRCPSCHFPFLSFFSTGTGGWAERHRWVGLLLYHVAHLHQRWLKWAGSVGSGSTATPASGNPFQACHWSTLVGGVVKKITPHIEYQKILHYIDTHENRLSNHWTVCWSGW